MLFGACYDKNIRMWDIPEKYECNYVTALVGHQSVVTAIEIIEEKNFLVSVDDRSILKCWDLSESGGTCF